MYANNAILNTNLTNNTVLNTTCTNNALLNTNYTNNNFSIFLFIQCQCKLSSFSNSRAIYKVILS